MIAIVSEMRALKGRGVGKDGVIGKLRIVDNRGARLCACVDDSADFFRAQGIAISRIEEAYEELSQKEGAAHIANMLQKMLEVIRDRALLAGINEITELGISLYDAISHIELEAEENTVTREVCLLLRRILRGQSGIELGDGEGYIGIICETLDVTETLSLRECGFLGFVLAQSRKSLFVEACELLGISALCLCEEDLCGIISGESAILYPEKNIIYLSPSIKVVDDFTAEMKSERRRECVKGIFKCLLGERIYSISEYESEGNSGLLMDMATDERSEEEIFELCRSALEIAEREIFVLLRNTRGARDCLRGILRAAVYGRLSLVTSFASSEEYLDFCESFAEIKNELRAENREFDSDIRQGIVIDNLFSFLLIDKFSKDAQIIFADIENLAKDLEKNDFRDISIAVIKMISDKFSDRNLPLLITSDSDSLKKIDADDMARCDLPLNKLFLVKRI